MRGDVKDCTNCTIPHEEGGYEYILEVVKQQVYGK